MQLQSCLRRVRNSEHVWGWKIAFFLQNKTKFVIICSMLKDLWTILFPLLIRSLVPPPPYPNCQTPLCLLGCLQGIPVESDYGVRLPAVTAPLLFVQALHCLSCLPQAVIQNPFSNGGSPAGEAVGGETRFAYFPATAVSDGAVSVQAATDPTLTQAGGESVLMFNLGWNLPTGAD